MGWAGVVGHCFVGMEFPPMEMGGGRGHTGRSMYLNAADMYSQKLL